MRNVSKNFVFVTKNFFRLISMLILILKKKKIDENTNAFKYLKETNERSDWTWRVFLKYGIGGLYTAYLAGLIVTVSRSLIVHGYVEVHEILHMYKLM